MANTAGQAKKILAKLQRHISEEKAIDAQLNKIANEIKNVPNPVAQLTGLLSNYMSLIKKSDGLTSARPATLKAIQAAEKTPNIPTISRAQQEIERHVDELSKSAKGDKRLKDFEARVGKLIVKLKDLSS